MKLVRFEGDSLKVIRSFPENARRRMGYEIDRVQNELDPLNWKPFPQIGSGVKEIRVQVGLQYRIIYVTKFSDKVHVLHAFQKKTQKTSKMDIRLAKTKLLEVARRHGK